MSCGDRPTATLAALFRSCVPWLLLLVWMVTTGFVPVCMASGAADGNPPVKVVVASRQVVLWEGEDAVPLQDLHEVAPGRLVGRAAPGQQGFEPYLFFVDARGKGAAVVTMVGGRGQGPGTFTREAGPIAADHGQVFVRNGMRLNVYDADGRFLTVFRSRYPATTISVFDDRLAVVLTGSIVRWMDGRGLEGMRSAPLINVFRFGKQDVVGPVASWVDADQWDGIARETGFPKHSGGAGTSWMGRELLVFSTQARQIVAVQVDNGAWRAIPFRYTRPDRYFQQPGHSQLIDIVGTDNRLFLLERTRDPALTPADSGYVIQELTPDGVPVRVLVPGPVAHVPDHTRIWTPTPSGQACCAIGPDSVVVSEYVVVGSGDDADMRWRLVRYDFTARKH